MKSGAFRSGCLLGGVYRDCENISEFERFTMKGERNCMKCLEYSKNGRSTKLYLNNI